MVDPVFKPKLPSFGNQDGDQVITSSGLIYEYNDEKREWVNIGVIPTPEVLDPDQDGLVSPELHRKLVLIQELIEQGFDFSKFKLATDVEDPYYYLFHSSDDLIRFFPERTSEPKEIIASIIVAFVKNLSDETAEITMAVSLPIQTDEWEGLQFETIHGNYDIISNTELMFVVKSNNINIFGGDRGKIVKPEAIQTRLRVEIDKGRLFQKLIKNCCAGPKGNDGDTGETGSDGEAAVSEVFQFPLGVTGGVFSWEAQVETPIDTPISLRIFKPDDDDTVVIEILHPLDGSNPTVIINDSDLSVEETSFESSYNVTSKMFSGSITIVGTDDFAGWRFKTRQRGAKGATGDSGKAFVEVIERLLEDPSIRSTQAIISTRKAAASDDIVILQNELFEAVPVSNFAALDGDSINNILSNQFVAAKFSISDSKDIGFFQFIPKEFIVPPLDIPLWTPTGECVQSRRWSQYRFNWFTKTDPNYLFSIMSTPKPPEQCCQEDFFFCPNVGDQPCGIVGQPNPPVPFPVECECECDNPIFSNIKGGVFVMDPIDLTDPANAVTPPVAQMAEQFEVAENASDVTPSEEVEDEGSGISDEDVIVESLSTVESVIDGSDNVFTTEVKLTGDGEITVTLDFDPDICGGAAEERKSCAFVDSQGVRASFFIENPDGTGTIVSTDVTETTEIPATSVFSVSANKMILPSEGGGTSLSELISNDDFKQKIVAIEPPEVVPPPPPGSIFPLPHQSFADKLELVAGGPINREAIIDSSNYAIKIMLDGASLAANGDGSISIDLGSSELGSIVQSPANNQDPIPFDALSDNMVFVGGSFIVNTVVAGDQAEGPNGPGTYAYGAPFNTEWGSKLPDLTVRKDSWKGTVVHFGAPKTTAPSLIDIKETLEAIENEQQNEFNVESPDPISITPDSSVPGNVPPSCSTTPTFKITSMVNLTGVDYCRGYRLTVSAKSTQIDPKDPGITVVPDDPFSLIGDGDGSFIAPDDEGAMIVDRSAANDLGLLDPRPQQIFTVTIIACLNNTELLDHANSKFADDMINGVTDGGIALIELKFDANDVLEVIANGEIALASSSCVTLAYVGQSEASSSMPVSIVPPPSFAGDPASIIITAGDSQSGVVGTALVEPICASVEDANGIAVQGAVVNFDSSDGMFEFVSVVTDANGMAKSGLTLGPVAGGQTFTVAVGGTSLSAGGSATAIAGDADSIALVSGGGQTAVTETMLTDPIVACVLDVFSNVVPGAVVTFTPSGTGIATPSFDVTDSLGKASTSWTLGSTIGIQIMTMSTPGAPSIQTTAEGFAAAITSFTCVPSPNTSATLAAYAMTFTTNFFIPNDAVICVDFSGCFADLFDQPEVGSTTMDGTFVEASATPTSVLTRQGDGTATPPGVIVLALGVLPGSPGAVFNCDPGVASPFLTLDIEVKTATLTAIASATSAAFEIIP